jgi:hypothetical protein
VSVSVLGSECEWAFVACVRMCVYVCECVEVMLVSNTVSV